ncbi:MAG: hypothetical protein ACK2UO_14415 [Caldilineaceae bacterium]|jgi:hypothetical protein
MGIIIQYVANYAAWIYAACGLVALYQIYRIWLVRSERRQAIFSLERDKAVKDTYNIFAIAITLLIAMGLTYFISTTLATAVQPLVNQALAPTPPLPFMPTPTNTPLPVTATPTRTPAPTIATTPDAEEGTQEPDDAPTIEPATPEPTVPVVVAPVCPDDRSVFIRPGSGEQVSGILNVIGTATHEAFDYYKVEYAPGASPSGGWVYIAGGDAPIVNNVLASFDTRALGNGQWSLRLIVVDKTGNYPPPCQVTFTVQN